MTQSSVHISGKLYFAYGSNLSVAQMARRCPDSWFYGTAILHGYRWQINERGVANVVPAAGSSRVQGLLYLVTARDEAALDLYEGVAGGFYQKHMLPVQRTPHPRYAHWPTDEVAEALEQPELSSPSRPDNQTPTPTPTPTDGVALVYISENDTTDGRIGDEYGARMQTAVRCAVALGVDRAYVDRVIAPFLGRGEAWRVSRTTDDQESVSGSGSHSP